MQLISTGRSKGGHVKRGKEDERSLLYGVENFALFFLLQWAELFLQNLQRGRRLLVSDDDGDEQEQIWGWEESEQESQRW